MRQPLFHLGLDARRHHQHFGRSIHDTLQIYHIGHLISPSLLNPTQTFHNFSGYQHGFHYDHSLCPSPRSPNPLRLSRVSIQYLPDCKVHFPNRIPKLLLLLLPKHSSPDLLPPRLPQHLDLPRRLHPRRRHRSPGRHSRRRLRRLASLRAALAAARMGYRRRSESAATCMDSHSHE
jgi:hypothetical protein